MKRIIFLSLIFFSFFSFSQEIFINLQTENLNGKIRSYSKKTFTIVKNSSDLKQKYAVKYSFDTNGNLVSIENYGDDTTIISKEIYKYKMGKLSNTTLFNAVGNAGKTTQYEHDDTGKMVSLKKYNNQGKLQYQIKYIYNQKGQLTTQQKLIPSINHTIKETFKYDNQNNLIEKSKTARIGTTRETFEYNSKKLQTKKSAYNAMGELFSIIAYKYNTHNDKISLEKFDANKTLNYYEKYDYTYDHKGNWTQRTSYKKGKKVSVENRTIVYF